MRDLMVKIEHALSMADRIEQLTPDEPGSMQVIQGATSRAIRDLAAAIKELSRHVEPDLR